MKAIDRDTAVFLSASSMPSQFGVSIYNALFAEHGINAVYLARKVTDAAGLAQALRALDVRGASVSMPLKNRIADHLDALDEEAAAVRSVNTVKNDGGVLRGFNTDMHGVREVLRGLSPESVLVYGSGSVVDSILHVLRGQRVFLTGRTASAVASKAEQWGARVHQGEKVDLFVNATPMSLSPLPAEVTTLLGEQRPRVFDLVVPRKDNFLDAHCAREGLAYVPGFEMYKHQLVRQLQIYTGVRVSTDDVERTARAKGLIA